MTQAVTDVERLRQFKIKYMEYVLNNGSDAEGNLEQREEWYRGLHEAVASLSTPNVALNEYPYTLNCTDAACELPEYEGQQLLPIEHEGKVVAYLNNSHPDFIHNGRWILDALNEKASHLKVNVAPQCEGYCGYQEPYGFVPQAECPVHDVAPQGGEVLEKVILAIRLAWIYYGERETKTEQSVFEKIDEAYKLLPTLAHLPTEAAKDVRDCSVLVDGLLKIGRCSKERETRTLVNEILSHFDAKPEASVERITERSE